MTSSTSSVNSNSIIPSAVLTATCAHCSLDAKYSAFAEVSGVQMVRQGVSRLVFPEYTKILEYSDNGACVTKSEGPINLETPFSATIPPWKDQKEGLKSGYSSFATALATQYNTTTNEVCDVRPFKQINDRRLPPFAIVLAATAPLGIVILMSLGIWLGRRASKSNKKLVSGKNQDSDPVERPRFFQNKPELPDENQRHELTDTERQKPELKDTTQQEMPADEVEFELTTESRTRETRARSIGSPRFVYLETMAIPERENDAIVQELAGQEAAHEKLGRSL